MKDITNLKLVDSYIEMLAEQVPFSHEVREVARVFEYSGGDMICERDNPLKYLLFIVQGKAKVFTMLENGRIYLLRIEAPIHVYGDIEMMYGETYTANVEALDGCRCFGVPIQYIRNHYLDDPGFLRFMVNSLANRLERISTMSTNNLLRPLRDRFAGYLMASWDGASDTVVIETSFIQVADQLGTTYRHLSRTISELEKEQIIVKKSKRFRLLNTRLLEEMAGDTYEY